MKTKGYSIWLIPKKDTFKELADLIRHLSENYSSPYFDPHATLVGGIIGSQDEVVKKTRKLASLIKPCVIQFDSVDYKNYYLRALFLRIKQKRDIMKANEVAKDVFNLQNTEKYMPHISLMYGNFTESVKKEIIKTQNLRNFKFSFLVDTVYLYDTNGRIEDWREIADFKLASS